MSRLYFIWIIIGVVYSSSCVYDAVDFQEVYNILKNKQVKVISRQVNDQTQTKLQILKDTSNSSKDDIFQNSMASKLFVPLQIIDISQDLVTDPTFIIVEDTVKAWEKKYGKIPVDSIVLIRTNNREKQFNGWDQDVLEYLFEDRNVTGIGYDQLKHDIPDEQRKFFFNKLLISQTDDLSYSNEYGNLIQIRKLTNIIINEEWFAEVITVIPQVVCSTPKRLMSQWGTIIIILTILLGLIALIWYCCLKRFDKYNKEQFQLQDWETRNQEGIFHNKEELHIPLQDLVNKKD